jgi:hypothetical protein
VREPGYTAQMAASPFRRKVPLAADMLFLSLRPAGK